MRIFEFSNRIEYLRQYSIRNEHNYSKFSNTCRHRCLTYLTEWRRFFTLATTPSTVVSSGPGPVYLLEVFMLAHYYETPTTETTIVQCHKNSWIYLTSTYRWWLLRLMITIRFEISNNSSTILFEMKKHCSHRTSCRHMKVLAYESAVRY